VVVSLGCNSRLDTIQAVVAAYVLGQAGWICDRRQKNAAFYDGALASISQIRIPPRNPRGSHSYVTYQVLVERRDELLACCNAHQIECKIHYPIPLYCQPGLRHLGYQPGSFPVTDRHAASAITIPVHQYLEPTHLEFVAETVTRFYKG
jgi:dTDP-3-amino-2,3,6-trideoxy-4-keto-D-glucose/dTDP-3-amino-3,4,6-trideoxy-alpha-D-glucose/dTDP-2,6-dideoxy-D-kanosamine transaminase